jgi:N-acyl-D-amino-acid deacylase
VRKVILSRRCAAAVGLIDRGALRPGFAAEITIFDPAPIADRTTFNEPREPT